MIFMKFWTKMANTSLLLTNSAGIEKEFHFYEVSVPHWLAPYPWKREKAYCKVWLPVFPPKVGNTILAKMKSLYDTELRVKKIWMYIAYTSLSSSPTVPASKKEIQLKLPDDATYQDGSRFD